MACDNEQMWALNSDRNSPDMPIKPGDKLSIGHKYQLRATDNFRYLSVQFATTRGALCAGVRACVCMCIMRMCERMPRSAVARIQMTAPALSSATAAAVAATSANTDERR